MKSKPFGPFELLGFTCVVAFAAALGPGCGSTVEHPSAAEGTAGTGGSGGSGASASSSGSGGGAGGSTTSSSSSSSGTGGGPCAEFLDEKSLGSVTLRFRNDSGVPIYLPASCTAVQYDLFPLAGADDVIYAFDGSCLQTCEDLQNSGPIFCRPCAPRSFLLPSGATRDVVWDGTGLRSVEMPAFCWEALDTAPTCRQLVGAKPGEYRVLANGFAGCDDGTGSCPCTSEGDCAGTASGLEAYADITKFDFPGSSVVEVVFGGCAFPCPNP